MALAGEEAPTLTFQIDADAFIVKCRSIGTVNTTALQNGSRVALRPLGMTNVAINGLGRIGRATLKIVMDTPGLNLVAANDKASILRKESPRSSRARVAPRTALPR
jgi:hypothetical protein